MFVDFVKMKLIAGKGGDGCTSFRREKFVPMGGPDGGNGGKGGSIIFRVEKGLKTLIDLKYHKILKASKGENGKGSAMHGKCAEDVLVKVPEGTTIYDDDTGLILADLTKDKEEFVVAKGGRGGRGNKAFATQADPAPKFSELGEPGETRYVRCELKVLADVGLIGMPSVGKSTILSQVSGASPKIASYHFTTLNPNLGLVKLQDNRSFVLADLPGLIEGASKGVGLGINFLKHAMRTRILAHVIDMAGTEGRNPWEDYEMIRQEITNYSEKLAAKKEIIIANKMDMPHFEENLKEFQKRYPELEVLKISAMNNLGLESVIKTLADILDTISEESIYDSEEFESTIIYKFENQKPFSIIKENDLWILKGQEIEKLFLMTRWDNDDAQIRFARKLKGMGVEEELEKMGAKRGDEVKILDYIFIFKE